jgi:phosphopantothenoylcysteine synthetase/decarboxylase
LLQGLDNSSGEETAAFGCDLNGLCFDDPEEEDDAEGEQDKERKGDDVCKGDREEER